LINLKAQFRDWFCALFFCIFASISDVIQTMAFPHDGKKFVKGQSGNPDGKPVGTKNRNTTLKKFSEVSTTETNNITKEIENLTQDELIAIALIQKCKSGDVQAIKEYFDTMYGPNTNKIETTFVEEFIVLRTENNGETITKTD
jgi:hypothetical protein